MMEALILVLAVVLVGCEGGKLEKTQGPSQSKPQPTEKPTAEKPLTEEESTKVIEAAIRKSLNKPTDELTKTDLEKVTKLLLNNNQLTSLKGLEKLTRLTLLWLPVNNLTELPKGLEKLPKLRNLWLRGNPDLTKAQITELQKALPKCDINSYTTK